MPLRIRPEAKEQADEAVDYYAGLDWRIGVRFADAYDAAIARIAADPTSHSLHHVTIGPQVRFKKLDGFPYLVLFRTTDPAETVVLAVLHTGSGDERYHRAERRG